MNLARAIDLDTIRTNYDLIPSQVNGKLKEKITGRFGLDTDHIKVSNSSLGLLRALIDQLNGDVGVFAPDYFEFFQVAEEIDKLHSGLAGVLLSNPNNPTGQYKDLHELVRSTRDNNSLLIVDEAYIEFVGEELSAANFVLLNPHVVVLRTFSKFYGIKEDKVGYVIGAPDLIADLDVNELSEYALLNAESRYNAVNKNDALHDVRIRRDILRGLITNVTTKIVDSDANFLMAKNGEYGLKNLLDDIDVSVVDLNKTPGVEDLGYVRIAVGSYEQLGQLKRRICELKTQL